nr:MAG TPA: hypothetical protein [Crassvirales sp.]
MISIGVGGLHSLNKPEIIVPNDDEYLMDYDAALAWRRRINLSNCWNPLRA